MTIVEGESLVNDATALVLYRVAVVAVTTGAFSLWEAGGRLILNAAAGIADRSRRRLRRCGRSASG